MDETIQIEEVADLLKTKYKHSAQTNRRIKLLVMPGFKVWPTL